MPSGPSNSSISIEANDNAQLSYEDLLANEPRYELQGSERLVPLIFIYPEKSFITTLHNNILSLKVSFTLDSASALTFDVVDPGFEMAQRNYFQVGQTVIYKSQNIRDMNRASIGAAPQYWGYPFEIADVTYEQSNGASPVVRIQAYTKAIQQMKRDRKPGVITGKSSSFVENAARKYGLDFVGQQTTKTANITTASGDKQADSVWDVIKRIAGENKFVVFEADGTLYFGSQKWLLHKWGLEEYTVQKWLPKKRMNVDETRYHSYLTYPQTVNNETGGYYDTFKLLQLPTMHKSENDPHETDGSCIVERTNGVRLRPGMTAFVGNVPFLNGNYLITSVDYEEMSPDPVSVQFRTPELTDKEIKQIKQIDVGVIYPGAIEFPASFNNISLSGTFNTPGSQQQNTTRQ
jgi:hypothetical protein